MNGSTPAQAIALASRSVNVIRYDIPPSLVRGLAASVTYSTGPFGNDGTIGNAGKGNGKSANIGYTRGPLFVGAGFWDAKSEDRNTTAARADQKSQGITASWNFGFAKVGVVYDVSAYDRAAAAAAAFTETKRSAWSIPLQYNSGPHAVMLTYSRANNTRVAGVTAPNTGARLVTLGYDYAFSKRTSVGVSYANMNNAAAALYGFYAGGLFVNLPAPVAGQDQRQVYLGMRHAF